MVETTAAAMRHVYQALSLLRPYDVVGAEKMRIGRSGDGGYVLLRHPPLPPVAYTFGVGDEISFEFQLAQLGVVCHMFDHTVAGLPYGHPSLHFNKEGLAAAADPEGPLTTLDAVLRRNGDANRPDMLLKVDVEGHEYAVLDSLGDETLRRFSQVALEVHWLLRLADPAFRDTFIRVFERLNRIFTLVHVHANNCAPLGFVESLPVADVLELTYVRSDLVTPTPSQTVYPTWLDCANEPGRQDFPLMFFPFCPAAPPGNGLPEASAIESALTHLDFDDQLRADPKLSHHDRMAALFARTLAPSTLQAPAVATPAPPTAPAHSAPPAPTPPPTLSAAPAPPPPVPPPAPDAMLNILYLACHETLEYDDVRMFTEMGHRVFSVGGLANPDGPKPATRPVMERFHSREWWDAFAADPAHADSVATKRISRAFAQRFDLVIVNHDPELIGANLDAFEGLPIIFRSIGQSNVHSEATLARYQDRVTIVRYSAREVGLPGFCRTDHVIYFGKFLSDYPAWEPGNSRAVTFHNSYPTRATVSVPSLTQYEELARLGPHDLYGFLNEAVGPWRGLAPADLQIELFRTAGVYFYVYSVPPSYTLSLVEAMLVGAPVIAPSAAAIRSVLGPIADQVGFLEQRYEVAELLDNDPALVWDSIDEAYAKTRAMLLYPRWAAVISERLRTKAAALFDVRIVSRQWQAVLDAAVAALRHDRL